VRLFSGNDADTSIIIDPIDGTLEYLEGADSFSVCVGIVHKNQLVFSIVYFPARDIAYIRTPDGKSLMHRSFMSAPVGLAEAVHLSAQKSRTVSVSRRVPDDIMKKISGAGFSVVVDDAYALGLLKVISGEAVAHVSFNPQMRDILIAPVIAAADEGFICTWDG